MTPKSLTSSVVRQMQDMERLALTSRLVTRIVGMVWSGILIRQPYGLRGALNWAALMLMCLQDLMLIMQAIRSGQWNAGSVPITTNYAAILYIANTPQSLVWIFVFSTLNKSIYE